METTSDFSIIKQKIIKTNDLLMLYKDKDKELKNVQSLCKRLNNTLVLSKEEIGKLKLKNESLSFSFEKVSNEYTPLVQEHSNLRNSYSKLENEYHESNSTWHLKYQTANQQLLDCQEELKKLQDSQSEPIIIEKPTKKQAAPDKKLLTERDSLKEENTILKSSLQLHLSESKKAEAKLILNKNELNSKNSIIANLQQELQATKDALKSLRNPQTRKSQEKTEDSGKLGAALKEIQTLQDSVESLKLENELLKSDNIELQEKLSSLEKIELKKSTTENVNLVEVSEEITETKTVVIQPEVAPKIITEKPILSQENTTDDEIPSDQFIQDIFKDTFSPAMISPICELIMETEKLVVLKEKRSKIPSTSGDFMVTNYEIPDTELQEFKTSHIRRKRLKKRKSKKVDLYGALLALKKANINFTLSSESLLEPNYSFEQVPATVQPKIYPSAMSRISKVYNKKLTCSLGCPTKNSSYMLLKDNVDDEQCGLLGFFSVKNEVSSRSSSRLSSHNDSGSETQRRRKIEVYQKKIDAVIKKTVNKARKSLIQPDNHEIIAEITEDEENKQKFEEDSEVNETRKISEQPGNYENIGDTTKDKEHKQEVIEKPPTLRKSERPKIRKGNAKIINAFNRIRYGKVTRSCKNTVQLVSNTSNYQKPCEEEIDHDQGKTAVHKRKSSNCETEITPKKLKPTENLEKNETSLPEMETAEELETQPEESIKPAPISPKIRFKRPVCRIRQSARLAAKESPHENGELSAIEISQHNEAEEDSGRPESPPVCDKFSTSSHTKVIPLEKVNIEDQKMATSKIEELFRRLINYSKDEKVLDEMVEEFQNQDPEYIAEAILEKISNDIYDTPDSKYSPAPIMTETQRVMLGFMSRLDKIKSQGVMEIFLDLAERRLLCCTSPVEIAPITRLYLAICKLRLDFHRMRRLCCDVFYFCGDIAVPFLFIVLTSWSEVLPHEKDSRDIPLARILVQSVYMKECNKPGFNLLPLRDLLIKFFGYPTERWSSDDMFQDLLQRYMRNPVRPADFPLLLFCKNHTDKWVFQKINESLKPLAEKISAENCKATVIILIGNLSSRFACTSKNGDVTYIEDIQNWMKTLIIDTTPDVVRRSVYFCINRLQKKKKTN